MLVSHDALAQSPAEESVPTEATAVELEVFESDLLVVQKLLEKSLQSAAESEKVSIKFMNR